MDFSKDSNFRQREYDKSDNIEHYNMQISDKAPEFDPTRAEVFEVELPYIDAEGNQLTKKVEAINACELPDLNTLDDSYTEKGNITCWEHGNFDRLHVFSSDLQKRSTIHIEYTYVVNTGESEKRFKSTQNLMQYLEHHGI